MRWIQTVAAVLFWLGLATAPARADDSAEIDTSTARNGCFALSKDRKVMAVGSYGAVVLWDLEAGKELRKLEGHSNQVKAVAFSADGKTLASGSSDETIKLWDLATGKEQKTIEPRSGAVASLAFSADGKQLVAGTETKLFVFDAASGKEVRSREGDASTPADAVYSPDGKLVAYSSNHGVRVTVLKVDTWEKAATLELKDLVQGIAFSPDGKLLATAGHDGNVTFFATTSWKSERTVAVGDSEIAQTVAFSPDGAKAVVATSSGVKIVTVATGKVEQTIKADASHDPAQAKQVAFTADGKRVLTLAASSKVLVWMIGK